MQQYASGRDLQQFSKVAPYTIVFSCPHTISFMFTLMKSMKTSTKQCKDSFSTQATSTPSSTHIKLHLHSYTREALSMSVHKSLFIVCRLLTICRSSYPRRSFDRSTHSFPSFNPSRPSLACMRLANKRTRGGGESSPTAHRTGCQKPFESTKIKRPAC